MKFKNCDIGKEVRLKGIDGNYEILDIDKHDPVTKVRIKSVDSNYMGFWVRHKDLKAIKK